MKKFLFILIFSFISNLSFGQLNVISKSESPEKLLTIRSTYAYLMQHNDIFYIECSTSNRFDNPILVYLGEGKESAKQTIEDIINFIENNSSKEIIKIDSFNNTLSLHADKLLGIKALFINSDKCAGFSSLNLSEFKKCLNYFNNN